MSGQASPRLRYAPLSTMLLALPYGVATGYVTVTLGYQLAQAGVDVGAVASVAALGLLPNTWKALWAPVVDVTLSARAWFLISVLATILAYAAFAGIPIDASGLPAIEAMTFVLSLAVSVSYIALARIVAVVTPDERRGVIGGWLNAGNVGGTGLGGGFGLFVAQHIPSAPWLPPVLLAAVSALVSLPILRLDPVRRDLSGARIGTALAALGRELWSLTRSRGGALALLISMLPLGCGALGNLWAAVASDWHASADTVALITGVVGGLVTVPGCLVGGWICDRMDRKAAYILFGLVMAGCALAMAALPRTNAEFIVWTLLYGAVTGCAYVGFTAYTLEVIGQAGAATKYTLLASIANTPIMLVTLIDGRAQAGFGSGAMLLTDAALGIGGACLYLVVASLTRRRPEAVPMPA